MRRFTQLRISYLCRRFSKRIFIWLINKAWYYHISQSLVLEVLKRFYKISSIVKLAAVIEIYFSLSNVIESSFIIKQFKKREQSQQFLAKTTESAMYFPTFPKVESLEGMEQCDVKFVKKLRNFKRHWLKTFIESSFQGYNLHHWPTGFANAFSYVCFSLSINLFFNFSEKGDNLYTKP